MLRLVQVSESFAVCLVLLDDFSVQKIIRIHRNDHLEFIHDVILQNLSSEIAKRSKPDLMRALLRILEFYPVFHLLVGACFLDVAFGDKLQGIFAWFSR